MATGGTDQLRMRYFIALASHNLASMKNDPIILANVVNAIAHHFGFGYQIDKSTISIGPYADISFQIDDLTPEMAAIYEVLEL